MLRYSDENNFDLNQERQTHTKFTSSVKVLEVISNVSRVKKAISFCIANINVLDIVFQPWAEGDELGGGGGKIAPSCITQVQQVLA